MRVRRLSSIAVLLLTSATLLAHAQDNRSQFKAGVELIQLDVVVLDGKRQPVAGLTAADFTVLDEGKPTPIRAFTPVELASRTRATEAVWASDVEPDVVTNQIGDRDGRLVIILLDRTISVQDPIETAKKIARAVIEGMGPNDLGAVVSTMNGAVNDASIQNLTTDRARLLRTIAFASPATGISQVAESIPTMGPLDPRVDGQCLCGVCVPETIARVADAVREVPRRRKVMFFIGSNAHWQFTEDQLREISLGGPKLVPPACQIPLKDARTAMLAAVDRANLTVHSIDPAGLSNPSEHAQAAIPNTGWDAKAGAAYGPNARVLQQIKSTNETLEKRENLALLPERTGGRTVVGMNNPEQAVPAILHESDSYYVLGIERAASSRPDGHRSIEVKVGRRGLRVVSQRLYGAPPAAIDPIRALLPGAGLPLSLAVMPFAGPDGGKPVVRVNVDAGAFARADGIATPLEVSILAVDRTGKGVASATQTSKITGGRSASGVAREVNVQSHLEVESGDYGIRVSVSDPATHSIASVFADATVPRFDEAALSLSGVSVETIESKSSAPAPTTNRTFARGDHVRAVLQIYQGTRRTDAIVPVSMRLQILDAKGTAIVNESLPFAESAFTNRRADCVVTLPLAKLPAGEYVLKLEASTARNTSGRALRFVVQ